MLPVVASDCARAAGASRPMHRHSTTSRARTGGILFGMISSLRDGVGAARMEPGKPPRVSSLGTRPGLAGVKRDTRSARGGARAPLVLQVVDARLVVPCVNARGFHITGPGPPHLHTRGPGSTRLAVLSP